MSQGGEVTTQQLVYGPDGKVYGNPALARAAGVNQTYRQDGTPYPETMLGNLPLSPSVPITEAFDPSAGIGEFERRQFLPNQPVPVPSQYQQVMGQTGGATPYERIMARMTPTMNPYGSVSGGYDPSFQGGYDPGLYSRLTRSGLINTGGGGGGGGGGSVNANSSSIGGAGGGGGLGGGGSGSAGSSFNSPGSSPGNAGSVTSAGTGGPTNQQGPFTSGGAGGAGGGAGSTGSGGSPGSNGGIEAEPPIVPTSGGDGGAAGAAVTGNSYITYTNTGTRNGAIVP